MTSFDLALKLIPGAFLETIYMVFGSVFFASLLGIPLGIALFFTATKKTARYTITYKLLSLLVNVGRSFPFAILMIAIIPFTKWIVGSSLGTTAAIVPLSLAAAPFLARLTETALQGICPRLIEASFFMGASFWQLLFKVLFPESFPSLIHAITLTAINLISYSAMAGLIGGGGLGQVAIQYGYNRFNTEIMCLTVACLILLVGTVQKLGNVLSNHLLKKRGQLPHA